jgi:hypothetical protein
MPRKAMAIFSIFPPHHRHAASSAGEGLTMHSAGADLAPGDRGFLLRLQRQALQYFIDNQVPSGLVLDRQSNHGPRRPHGLCSTTATGMGFIALALASAPPYRLLSRQMAALRIRVGLRAAIERLPHDHGVVPHFIHSATGAVHGADVFSTIETAWLLTGALWASAFLQDSGLEALAAHLYERVDWEYWTAAQAPFAQGLIRHGKGSDGAFLTCSWDRANGETAFMYVLAAGAHAGRAIAAESWQRLQPFYSTVGGLRFSSADLGLFVFQYGLDLLDLQRWHLPGEVDLWEEARLATLANQQACKEAADRFATYRRLWGLSPGDGPGERGAEDSYRCYAPVGPIDGTAHLTAALASVVHSPGAVLQNLYEAQHDRELRARGRYGFSSMNLDQHWIARDMVGIDAGATVLALDNYLINNRVRRVFEELPCVRRGLERLGFRPVAQPVAVEEQDAVLASRLAS